MSDPYDLDQQLRDHRKSWCVFCAGKGWFRYQIDRETIECERCEGTGIVNE